MLDIETNFMFYKEVNLSKKIHEILNRIDGIHIKYIAETEKKEGIIVFGYEIEDENEIEPFIDKLASIDGKKAFSIDLREVKVNPLDGLMEVLIPYIPKILLKFGT